METAIDRLKMADPKHRPTAYCRCGEPRFVMDCPRCTLEAFAAISAPSGDGKEGE